MIKIPFNENNLLKLKFTFFLNKNKISFYFKKMIDEKLKKKLSTNITLT